MVLKQYDFDFTCGDHVEWGSKFAIQPMINLFFNNKETIATDSVRKDAVVEFKKRQRLR